MSGIFLSYGYSEMLGANLGFVAGYVTALTISYLLNSFVNFKTWISFIKFLKFAVSYIPNFLIQNIIVLIVYNKMHQNKLLAYCLAAILGIPMTFFFIRVFAFGKDGRK